MKKFCFALCLALAVFFLLTAGALADGNIQIYMDSQPVSGTVTIDLSRQSQAQLSADVPVTWSRSSSRRCSIDESALMILKATGNVTVTAKSADGAKASVRVKIVRGVTGIALTGKTELTEGQSTRLKATVSPSNATSKSIVWSSSDPSVVTVNKYGTIKAMPVDQTKTAVIYATAKDGTGVVGELAVTVRPLASSVTLYLNGEPVNGKTLALDMASVSALNLTASVEPADASQTLKWSTSSSSRAKVLNGLVSARKRGLVTITATAEDGSRVRAWCKIDIGVISKSISITGPDSVNAGKTARLSCTVLPTNTANKRVIWSSSNPAAASVDSRGTVKGGDVTARTTVTIYATAQDGGCVGSRTITVVPRALGINISRDGSAIGNVVFLDGKGSTVSLSTSVYPADAAQSVTWSTSNRRVVQVSQDGTLTGMGEGKAIVTVKANDGSNFRRSFYVASGNQAELPYYVEVDKTNQVVRVYERGDGSYSHLIRRMICSTGRLDSKLPDGLYRLNGSRAKWMRSGDPSLYMQYSTRIYGSFLFHCVPTLGAHADRVKVDYYNKLGTRASGGCIRLLCADAKWIYENLPKNSYVLVLHSPRDAAEYGSVYAPPIVGSWDPTDDNPANPYYDPTYTSLVG